MRVTVKIPAPAMKERPAVISRSGADEILVAFDEPQRAITPGQAAVFYDGDVVVGRRGGLLRGRRQASVFRRQGKNGTDGSLQAVSRQASGKRSLKSLRAQREKQKTLKKNRKVRRRTAAKGRKEKAKSLIAKSAKGAQGRSKTR